MVHISLSFHDSQSFCANSLSVYHRVCSSIHAPQARIIFRFDGFCASRIFCSKVCETGEWCVCVGKVWKGVDWLSHNRTWLLYSRCHYCQDLPAIWRLSEQEHITGPSCWCMWTLPVVLPSRERKSACDLLHVQLHVDVPCALGRNITCNSS